MPKTDLREQMAAEAARIIATEGVQDYGLAKRKAAIRLGNNQFKHLPTNREIEQALQSHQRMFSNTSAQHQQALLAAAAEALTFFDQFSPKISGSLANGTVTEHCALEVHLFADPIEQIEQFLDQQQLPYTGSEKRFRYHKDQYQYHRCYQFSADNIDVIAIAFSRQHLRQTPLSPINGQPMQRLNTTALNHLNR